MFIKMFSYISRVVSSRPERESWCRLAVAVWREVTCSCVGSRAMARFCKVRLQGEKWLTSIVACLRSIVPTPYLL